MADEKVEKVTEGSDEEALKAELEDDGIVTEEDEDGKPLPWNHPKVVRRIYKDAKQGRQAAKALKELGFKPSDVPTIKGIIEEWKQFRSEYDEWEKRKDEGDTTKTEDREMTDDETKWARIEKMLRARGVKFTDSKDEEKEAKKAEDNHLLNMTRQAHATIMDSLEESGLFKGLDEDDKQELFEEFDFKVGSRLKRDATARAKFVQGSLRPIRAIINELLEKRGVTKVEKPDEHPRGTGIRNLPPRGSSTPGSAVKRPTPEKVKEPQTVKEATEQMVADLRAKRKA